MATKPKTGRAHTRKNPELEAPASTPIDSAADWGATSAAWGAPPVTASVSVDPWMSNGGSAPAAEASDPWAAGGGAGGGASTTRSRPAAASIGVGSSSFSFAPPAPAPVRTLQQVPTLPAPTAAARLAPPAAIGASRMARLSASVPAPIPAPAPAPVADMWAFGGGPSTSAATNAASKAAPVVDFGFGSFNAPASASSNSSASAPVPAPAPALAKAGPVNVISALGDLYASAPISHPQFGGGGGDGSVFGGPPQSFGNYSVAPPPPQQLQQQQQLNSFAGLGQQQAAAPPGGWGMPAPASTYSTVQQKVATDPFGDSFSVAAPAPPPVAMPRFASAHAAPPAVDSFSGYTVSHGFSAAPNPAPSFAPTPAPNPFDD